MKKRKPGIAKEPTTRDVEITEEQVRLIVGLSGEVQLAQQRLNLVMAGVLAGHGISDVPVLNLDTDRRVLTVGIK